MERLVGLAHTSQASALAVVLQGKSDLRATCSCGTLCIEIGATQLLLVLFDLRLAAALADQRSAL